MLDGSDFESYFHDYAFKARFSEDGSALTMWFRWGSSLTLSLLPIDDGRLDYLALGDSFSSGEGDLGIDKLTKKNYYRMHTDDDGHSVVDGYRVKLRPAEKCHISTRSYPYKLATGMELGAHWNGDGGDWGSVACSGALMSDIDGSASDEYAGQVESGSSIPRLRGYDHSDLKDKALNDMIPGRQKQIEFVEKYKPKIVTLTAGGNDVMFERVIRACVQPIGFGSEWTSTCSYAKDDDKKVNLANAIIDLRPDLVRLYQEILGASGYDTKLYVLGYPVFVDDERTKSNYITENIATCGANVRLNYQERQMVAESTKFLNKIIQSAAREAGAIYISTSNAFGDYKLCGKSSPKAANGISGAIDNDESFHPNEFGHGILANRVWDATSGRSLLDHECDTSPYVTCPDYVSHEVITPDYFKKALADSIKTKLKNEMSENIFTKIDKAVLTIADYTLLFNSPLAILLYSDKTELGTFITNEQGGFTGEITIPESVKPGYHTLEVVSTDADGDPIKLWKIVEVRSGDPNDYDGDGIPNDQDYCTYIQPIGIDADEDGIDDGCDLEVSNVLRGATRGRVEDRDNLRPNLTVKNLYIEGGKSIQSESILLAAPQQDVIDSWNIIRKESLSSPTEQNGKTSLGLLIGLATVVLATVTVSAILLSKRN